MPLHELHWEATNGCNLNCTHCLPRSGQKRNGELSTVEALAAVSQFRLAGVKKIYFTGGEPFSRNDFLNLLKKVVAQGMSATVISNGTLLDRERLGVLQSLSIGLGISLDGADATTNDAIRGQGTFERVLKTLDQCQSLGIPTSLYVTLTKQNLGQINQFGCLAQSYGCRTLHLNEITLAGRALDHRSELALQEGSKGEILERASEMVREVFDEELGASDEGCWVDGQSLYMTADGKLYVCSEVFQRKHELAFGNIRQLDLKKWSDTLISHGNAQCCYGVRASAHVVLIQNTDCQCAFAPAEPVIETLEQLYSELETLYRGIEHDCFECQDPDCVGYVWLLKREAKRLYERGVPIVEVNGKASFIHSFPEKEGGSLDLGVQYPPCSQLCTDSRRCKIHADRPLTCRLYPIGLETLQDGTVVWALHHDCLHTRRLGERGTLQAFENRARLIVRRLSEKLRAEIARTYHEVHAVSAFPKGENNYSILEPCYVKM